MRKYYSQIFFGLAILLTYSLFFYFIFTKQQILDFFCFYSSTHALMEGENPYLNYLSDYFPKKMLLSANLNPPIVLWSLLPLVRHGLYTAIALWSVVSMALGLISAGIVFYYAFSPKFLRKNSINLYLFFLAFFPTIMNVATLQFGMIIFFFLILGYHFYINNRNYLAGIFWGVIIAVKFFPALLFFYVLKQGRFKVFWVMLGTFLIACCIPLLVYGSDIYKTYFLMMSAVRWYGDAWNASVCGFIFRIATQNNVVPHILFVKLLYACLFFIMLFWYWKKMGPVDKSQVNHQPFCLTLAMMLLMSPLGWLYYFPVLIFPLILTWFSVMNEKKHATKSMLIWFLSLFLINFPLDYTKTMHMTSNLMVRMSFYSAHFYGLILLTYLLARKEKIYGYNEIQNDRVTHHLPEIIIFSFGAGIPTFWLIVRFLIPGLDIY
ncbi:MAG: glycosyltransferase family 87 protein [Legionella sp.]